MITKGTVSIVPHQNWRGQFARGTYASGLNAGKLSDCPASQTTGCVQIAWPGERTTARHEIKSSAGTIQNWFGGLVDGMRDASGQIYMRNRYYDPASGQFTQPDLIGLAGGLNAFGFADGDPVSYSDPYGLSSCPVEFGGDGATDRMDDCPAGSPGWYGNRIANRKGSSVLNAIGGVLSSCGHSGTCRKSNWRRASSALDAGILTARELWQIPQMRSFTILLRVRTSYRPHREGEGERDDRPGATMGVADRPSRRGWACTTGSLLSDTW